MRWAWRLFRREWRQQALVLALLTLAVASAIGFASAAYNTAGVPENAVFGTANHLYQSDEPDPDGLPTAIAAAEERFGAVDMIARWSRPVAGSVESIEFRAQDPEGAFSAPMLALREGTYPARAREIALTDGVAETLQLGIGSTFDVDGSERTVVGLVENPSDLNDEFALVAPTGDDAVESVTILIGGLGSFDEVRMLRDFGDEHLPEADVMSRSDSENVGASAVAVVLGIATLVVVLVSLVAAAGFVAVAQRRLRQLGMLGAIGATERHLRLVVIANGAVIGVVAAAIGAAVGATGWVAVATRMEGAVGHRIDPWNVPWWVIGTAMALVIVAATGAAWWPARAVARVPITSALSGRPSRPQPAHHSAAAAAVLIAVGVVCLVLADRTNALLVVTGTVAVVAGVLLLSPLAIRALAATARGLPISMRLALRDLALYRARSAMALAAISLALGIPVTIVVTATAAEHTAELGNLSNNQLLIWTRDPDAPEGVSPYYTEDPNDEGFSPYLPRLSPADLTRLEADVGRIVAPLDEPTVTALQIALDPAIAPTPDGRVAVTVAQQTELGYLDVALLYVATAELLEQYSLDLGAADPETELITVPPSERLPSNVLRLLESDELWFSNTSDPPEIVTNVETLAPGYSSLPGSFITPEALRKRGWGSMRVGWLVETRTPPTAAQLATGRDLAAAAGLLIEARRDQASLVALRWGATAVGILLALGVLAMTVGLIRGEGARELRTLTATGATSVIRRTLTAATAGGLALLGVTLGIVGAYIALAAGYFRDIGTLSPVPVLHLGVIAVGVPLAAAIAGWLLAGREPPALTRHALE